MNDQDKLSKLFYADGTKEKRQTTVEKSVNDPRIDSPEIKVIYADMEKEPEKEIERPPMIMKTATVEELPEVTITPKAKTDTKEVEEPHQCKVNFGEAFKQHWIALTGISLGLLTIGFLIARATKKIKS